MLCDKCGMQLSEDAVFCIGCGKHIEKNNPNEAMVNQPVNEKGIEFILSCLKLTQLKELCSKYELKVSGNKDDLLFRLQESIPNLKDLLREFTVPVLKEICEQCEWDEDGETYCLSTSGKKDELIDRISEHLEEQDKGITKVVEEPEVTEKLSSSEQKTTQQHNKTVEPPVSSDNISKDSPETLQALEETMNGLLIAEKMKISVINFGFCGACKKRHPRQWFNFESEEKSLYLCRIGTSKIVVQDRSQEKSSYQNFTPEEFIDKYNAFREKAYISENVLQNDLPIQESEEKVGLFQKMRTFFQRKDVQQGIQKGAKTLFKIIEVVGTPPFTQLAKVGEVVLKQYTSKKIAQN